MAQTTSRILELLGLLQTHRQWSGDELASRLGITERTLRRDIERLRSMEYRIEATRGVSGGYRLVAGAQLPPLHLTDDEAVTIAIGLRLAAARGLADGETTTITALAKFEQLLPAELRRRVNAVGDVVPIGRRRDGGRASSSGLRPPTSTGSASQELLGQLALACRDSERIRFHYVAADGTASERVVEPHSVVAAEQAWFLVCWDSHREAWRTFRIDRMSRFFGTRVRAARRELPGGDAAEYVRRALRSRFDVVRADVRIGLPVDEVHRALGSWGDDAAPVDEQTTAWPVTGESEAALVSALAYVPGDAAFGVSGDAEVLRRMEWIIERMHVAIAAATAAGAARGLESAASSDETVVIGHPLGTL